MLVKFIIKVLRLLIKSIKGYLPNEGQLPGTSGGGTSGNLLYLVCYVFHVMQGMVIRLHSLLGNNFVTVKVNLEMFKQFSVKFVKS